MSTLGRECRTWIDAWDWVSFIELQRWLDDHGVVTAGDQGLDAGWNTFLWGGMSVPFVGFVLDEIIPHVDLYRASSLLVYVVDGGVPDLPVAVRPPREGYKQPHWLPIVLRTRGRRASAGDSKRLLPRPAVIESGSPR